MLHMCHSFFPEGGSSIRNSLVRLTKCTHYITQYQVLKERLGVRCVLGLTATATRTTALSVASHLSVAEENIIRGTTIPSNLQISASCDDNRDDVSLSCTYKCIDYNTIHTEKYIIRCKCINVCE